MPSEAETRTVRSASLEKARDIMFNPMSTAEQRATAEALRTRIAAERLEELIASVAGRTQILETLITDLNAVIASVEVDPPWQSAVEDFTGLLDQASGLLDGEE